MDNERKQSIDKKKELFAEIKQVVINSKHELMLGDVIETLSLMLASLIITNVDSESEKNEMKSFCADMFNKHFDSVFRMRELVRCEPKDKFKNIVKGLFEIPV